MRARVRVQVRTYRTSDTAWAVLTVLIITGALAALWQPLGVIFLALVGALWALVGYARHVERTARHHR